jgi:hypothetical protein
MKISAGIILNRFAGMDTLFVHSVTATNITNLRTVEPISAKTVNKSLMLK